ncbi:cupin domain-containing protein [Candidatus Pelagibacter sp.]|uniref:cupin domain-containing protein n=1 Tax=Candidatus Pelagibacter sp. TaxID=2024849 RepID=UPI003F87EA4F
MNNRLAKFEDLVPSTLPFVEGKLEGHRERKNYSIVGPGVAEDSKQFVKIAMPHSFNLGAVSALPKNGSGLHSHTTAEVFIIYSGKWRFYWGAEGKDETILSAGDIISMPTNMFRGFENAGNKEGLIFVVLGGDDPGIITWVPSILEKAKQTGMALLNDNSLIDLSLNEIPKDKSLLKPISSEEIKKFDNYKLNELEKYICKFSDRTNYENKINEDFNLIQVLGGTFQDKKFNPVINQNTGFNFSILKAKKGKLENLKFLKPTIMFSQKGSWQIKIDDFLMKLNPRDTISIPINSQVNIEINDDEENLLNCVNQI